MKSTSLTEQALKTINLRGTFALAEASRKIIETFHGNDVVSDALNYYAKGVFPKVLPIFPTLIYLSCKAVGGDPEKTKPVAAAMLLITASGDIHDDILDNSASKFERKTVFGKYGRDIALLAGDALLIQGSTYLQNNCEFLSSKQRRVIADLIAKAMFEIVQAEAIEVSLWKKTEVTPDEYFEVIKIKGGIAELHCRIGAIIGGADKKALDDTASYGRVIGILSTMKEEFIDIVNPFELQHRINSEIPPYPMLCAFQNEALKKQISLVFAKNNVAQKDLLFASETVLNSVEVQKLKAELEKLSENELANNMLLKTNKRAKELVVLIKALAKEL